MIEYTFVVSDASEIDVDRIIKEQKEADNHVSLIVSQGGIKNRYILVSNEFLSPFRDEDEVRLCDNRLSPDWGYTRYRVGQDGPDGFFIESYGSQHLKNGRWMRIPIKMSVKEIKQELEVARSYVRRIRVNVHTI